MTPPEGLEIRTVLAVESGPLGRKALIRFLGWAGVPDIVFTDGNAEALDLLDSTRPDLLLLDAEDAVLSAAEACRTVRAAEGWRDLPVLVKAASRSDALYSELFQAGANDVLDKPLVPGEVVSRIRLHAERSAMVRELRGYRDRVADELRKARDMQASLVPRPEAATAAAGRAGLRIDAATRGSPGDLHCDFWTFIEIPDGRLGVLVAHATGNGVTASIAIFSLHARLRRLAPGAAGDPALVLSELNDEICTRLPPGHPVTAFYGVFDAGRRQLDYALGGACRPIRARDGRLSLLGGSGMPLGSRDSGRPTRREALLPGDQIIMASDGLLHEPAPGRSAGEDGLLAAMGAAMASGLSPIRAVTDQGQGDAAAVLIALA